MKMAADVYREFVASSFRVPTEAAEMFAEDGVFELPYLASVGIPSRYQGRQEIAEFFQFVRNLYPGFEFENFTIRLSNQDTAYAEYEFRATSAVTGRAVHQLFFGFLETRDGKIIRLREALNGFEIVRGLVRDVRADESFFQAVNGQPPEYPAVTETE